MKYLVWITFALSGASSWAYPCPQDVDINPQAKAAYTWMNRFQGKQNMKGCYVEITACNIDEPREGAVIGEVYVVDANQREAYFPLTMVNDEARKIKTSLEVYGKSFYYIKHDTYFEEQFGRTEAYRLDLHLDKKGEYLKSLALGTYATRKKIHSPDGNQSRWYSCGDAR